MYENESVIGPTTKIISQFSFHRKHFQSLSRSTASKMMQELRQISWPDKNKGGSEPKHVENTSPQNPFGHYERHIHKMPSFLYKNILMSIHKVRDTWTSVTQLKFHFFRHLQIITSEENSVRRLNNESIWNQRCARGKMFCFRPVPIIVIRRMLKVWKPCYTMQQSLIYTVVHLIATLNIQKKIL